MRKEQFRNALLATLLFWESLPGCTPIGNRGEKSDTTPTIIPHPLVTDLPINDLLNPSPETIPTISKEVDFSIPGPIKIDFSEPIGKKISSAEIVIYPPDLGVGADDPEAVQNAWLEKNFAPGQKRILSVKPSENANNFVLYLHSGYKGGALEAEPIREFLQGFDPKLMTNVDHVFLTMQKLLGIDVVFNQSNISSIYKIVAVVEIPHNQINLYDSDVRRVIENALVISKNANKTNGATEILQNIIRKNGKKYLAISFCGWGPDKSDELNPRYVRFLILLELKE